MVTSVGFLGDGIGGNKMITRSADSTMKLWDCRMLSDAKGPLVSWEDLPAANEKTGVCSSPDGRYVVTGTSVDKASKATCSLKVFSTEDFSLSKSLDFGQRSIIAMRWQREINQLVVGTSAGEAVMLYNPYSSKKGALHFVGKHKRAKAAENMEDAMMGPIFCMTEPKDCQKFFSMQKSKLPIMMTLRRTEARENQKTIVPDKPPELEGKTATTAGTKLVSQVILGLEGKSKVADSDSQKALLKYAAKEGEKSTYMKLMLAMSSCWIIAWMRVRATR
jgi:hypothetical protein